MYGEGNSNILNNSLNKSKYIKIKIDKQKIKLL